MHNWALIGTGRVSEQMAAAINKTANAALTAVYSPTKANRDKFAAKYQVAQTYESIEELLTDPKIEIVYIASPNNRKCKISIFNFYTNIIDLWVIFFKKLIFIRIKRIIN